MSPGLKNCKLHIRIKIFTLILITMFSGTYLSKAELCGKWGEAEKSGVLDHHLINEASGTEASDKYPGRLYHINDSGGGYFFYISDMKGGNTQKIRIDGEASKYSDFEDISLGKCFDESCLFIGDIGDNKSNKKAVEIIIIEESQEYKTFVKPIKRLKVKYPDGSHNAEGLAVHPNGDIYIITKEENLDEYAVYPSKIYRLPASKWQDQINILTTLDYVGEIDLRIINPSGTAFGQVVSAFDISPDGSSFIVLTYENAVEFNIDLSHKQLRSTKKLVGGKDYQIIELKPLPQQESIAYTPDGKSFLYDTEHHWFEAPILKVDCLD